MPCVELTLLGKNPDNPQGKAEGTLIYVDIDDIITAYRFSWQDFTIIPLRNSVHIQVAELPEEILCYKDW